MNTPLYRWSLAGIHATSSLSVGPVLDSRVDKRAHGWQIAALPFVDT